MALYSSALQLIGNTPLVRLSGLEKAYDCQAQVYGKVEFFNPAGSVKDRAALGMIEQAEKDGKLKAGATVIEATSGNTGIALAMVCRLKGYSLIVVMPDTMSEERQKSIKAYGATLVLTDGAKGMQGAVEKAEELNKSIAGSFVVGQFSSPANAQIHYQTTGVEIYQDLPDIDIFVSAVGSGGTITGTGRYLKEQNPNVKIIAVEPSLSPVLSGGKKGAHKIQGIGAGFIPDTLDTGIYNQVCQVQDEQAYHFAKSLSKADGLFVGISSGAALAVAVELAKKTENKDKKIVVILPDGGGRYLSTDLID